MRRNSYGIPVVSIDIDGTLADYHGWFLQFAELYFNKKMPNPRALNPGMPLHKFMGVSKAEYRDCKLAYRQGGMKRSMPCIDGASWVVNHIRESGAEVWICTTRPYLRLDNIDPDTEEWLRRNKITYDALLFDPAGRDDKYKELKRQAGFHVAAVVEDLPEQAEKALQLGIGPVFLRNQPYNQHWSPPEPHSVWRWDTVGDLRSLVDRALKDWREKWQQTVITSSST